ncbi:hypothetical protein [Chitinophaga nivalis]|uniref:Uncharacterized protein n=1 Tax=Chitinophaga nivalis TaxID=2991709 RepID=A0ABT3IUY1_9BACT|nr:hypothetical protein [Chitinophaga nivalis]MCW3462513.1 hypothetical protein [Chitinophaga nivalis]MCW3487796.1 hypothetical protein [Chitinophaga nivalis]
MSNVYTKDTVSLETHRYSLKLAVTAAEARAHIQMQVQLSMYKQLCRLLIIVLVLMALISIWISATVQQHRMKINNSSTLSATVYTNDPHKINM